MMPVAVLSLVMIIWVITSRSVGLNPQPPSKLVLLLIRSGQTALELDRRRRATPASPFLARSPHASLP